MPEGDDGYRRSTEALVAFSEALVRKTEFKELLREFSERFVEVLAASEAALLLASPTGDLHVIASSRGELEPCELRRITDPARASHVTALRYRSEVIGVVHAFAPDSYEPDPTSERVAQALADVAAYAIAQARAVQQATDLAAQLQEALSSRVVIEQAKGVLSERLKIDVSEAFGVLRRYSRNRGFRISQVAADLVEHRLSTEEVVAGARALRPRRRTTADQPL